MNIVLGPTRDTYVDVREVKVNKFFDELEDFLSRRWNGRYDRTLVESIHDDVRRSLRLEGDHFFETIYHGTITGLPYTAVM